MIINKKKGGGELTSPLDFEKYVENLSNNEELFKLLKMLTRAKKSNLEGTNFTYLGKGKNGVVYKVGENTTIKILEAIDTKCPINNKFVKYCTGYYNEVMIGILVSNLVKRNECLNFPVLQRAYIVRNIGVIIRDFSQFVFEDFLQNNLDETIINNLILQYFLAVAIIHDKYQSMIFDNKFTNIYVKKYDGKSLIYRVRERNYEIPCYGYLIIIGDYGSNKFFYPTDQKYFVQMVKYTNVKNLLNDYLKKMGSMERIRNGNKPKNVWDELHYEKTRQIYFEGLFNPFIEHVYFMSYLIKFAEENKRHFPIIKDYVYLTDYHRNGISLLRKNLSAIELVDKLAPEYGVKIY